MAEGKTGRPEKPINWDDVDFYLMSGANQNEICATIGIDKTNFIPRFKEKHGVSFTTYATEMRGKGDNLLRAAQMRTALNKQNKGSTQMQIWLGKVRLGQKENSDDTPKEEIKKLNDKFDQIMNFLDSDHSSTSNSIDINSKNDNKS